MKIKRTIMNNEITIELTERESEDITIEYIRSYIEGEIKNKLLELGYQKAEEISDKDMTHLVDDVMIERGGIFGNFNTLEGYISKAIDNNCDMLKQYKEGWKVYRKRVTMTMTHDYTIRAHNDVEAEQIYQEWSEHHGDVIEGDMTEDVMYNAEWDDDSVEECEGWEDPNLADIIVE